MEMTMFIHFGVNTFTDKEWGEGTEDPNLFQPTELDCRQWVRAAKEAGFKLMILTARHHDGFCLWTTAFTDHSVKNSPWRDGKGDVLGEFVHACQEQDMKYGFYLSPWDRHDPRYGGPEYNDYFKAQLAEIMSTYGTMSEVWFDGAHRGEITPYDWPGFYEVVYSHNPSAVIAICGPDVRWVGNEDGMAKEGESSVQSGSKERHPGKTDKVWYPAECDVSIRPGWFYHASQDSQVKSLDHLLDIYFKSVGRNSVLLLNVPPNPAGLFAGEDVKRLQEFRAALDEIFSIDFLANGRITASNVRSNHPMFSAQNVLNADLDTYWATDDEVLGASLEIQLPEPQTFNVINVQEAIFLGERVQGYHVDAFVDEEWQQVAQGTVIGHRNLLRIDPITSQGLRLVIDEAKACPAISRFSMHFNPRGEES